MKNTLKYTWSLYGSAYIAVGIVGDKQEAEEAANLAENIYGASHSDEYFDHIMYLKNFKQFKKFLILKEYFLVWSNYLSSNTKERPSILRFTKEAITRAKHVLKNDVKRQDFMQSISQHNTLCASRH